MVVVEQRARRGRARPGARRAAQGLLLLLLPGLSGCSFLFVDAAPKTHARMHDFECTSSIFMPLSDSGWATAFAYVAADAVLGASEYDTTEEIAVPAATAGVLAGLAVASAIYGYSTTRECQLAKGDLMRRAAARDAAEGTPASHR